MKSLKILAIATVSLLSLPFQSGAQNQMVWIHDDHVKPAMFAEYSKAAKELADACKKHNLQNADWMTIRLNNGTYRSVAAIDNMAELDANLFAPLAEKMGKENLAALWDRFDKCYDKHNSYTIINMKELTYMPDGFTMNPPGQDYRKFHYFYVTPSGSDAAAEKIKAIKAVYAKKGAKENFRVYRSGFGCAEEFYVAVISAKDEQSYIKTSDETEALLGEEGRKAIDDLMKTAERYEVIDGYLKADLGYTSKK